MAKTLFVSNEPLYVEHFNILFEDLWKNGIDAEDRIREIEEGIAPIITKILKDENEIINEIRRLNNSASRLIDLFSIWRNANESTSIFLIPIKK